MLIHAYGDFVTADGTRLEGRGVIPDEVVPLDRGDLLAGRDRTLDAALAWIDAAAADRPGLGVGKALMRTSRTVALGVHLCYTRRTCARDFPANLHRTTSGE